MPAGRGPPTYLDGNDRYLPGRQFLGAEDAFDAHFDFMMRTMDINGADDPTLGILLWPLIAQAEHEGRRTADAGTEFRRWGRHRGALEHGERRTV